jgi:hypothetical protein
MIVTGVGTRSPNTNDQSLCDIMLLFCRWASARGATLRSGSAVGMDSWFERLWTGPKEIYIPRETYKPDRQSPVVRRDGVDGAIALRDDARGARASSMARSIHPAWNAMGVAGKQLHTRNVFQVLGFDLNEPSDLIVYYANYDSDGIGIVGGTRTAVMLARQYNIPEYNLILPDDIDRLLNFMETYDDA